jgi:hypothetical protein
MHAKRMATLAVLVDAAMKMRGMGVLALGRAVAGRVDAKHDIKKVWRFLRNPKLEMHAVCGAIARAFSPAEGPIIVLADWTDFTPYTQLVFALSRDGRALPLYCRTVRQAGGEGCRAAAEQAALQELATLLPSGRRVIIVADRGFASWRWMEAIEALGWHYVQRMPRNHLADMESYIGPLQGLKVRCGTRAKDYGWGTLSEAQRRARLVVCRARDAKEPWYLATNIPDQCAAEIVRYYQRRMWIEAMFRDWKNKDWGLGMRGIKLKEPERHDRLFLILALAYIFLSAFGALAERNGMAKTFKANTENKRVVNLLRMGLNLLIRTPPNQLDAPWAALSALPT